MVNFSPQQGHEIKWPHYAITITKKDQPYIATLTVIPLTSKGKKYLTSLGTWFGDSMVKMIQKKLDDHVTELLQLQSELISIGPDNFKDETVITFNKKIEIEKLNQNELKELTTKYKDIQKASFANVYQITTIDKSRIISPINKFDPIQDIRVPNYVMDKIDEEIKRLFIK